MQPNHSFTVTHFYREPRNTGVSIEGIFKTVKSDLEGQVVINNSYCNPALSRIKNTTEASKYAGDVNHITGDVNFLALGLRGRKNILTIHDFGFYENPIHSKIKHLIYHTFWFALPLHYIDVVTVVSEFTKEKLVRYFKYPAHKIRVIADPVKPIFSHKPKLRPSHKPVVLMLGTGKHKNLDNLIAAAKDLDIHLDIVGWPAPDELQKLKEYNIAHTIYNNLTDEQVFERYIACDILFIASLYEGFGMPIIEAQAVGRPVITSNIGAMLEVGKDSTLLVNPLQPEEIKAAISRLISDNELYNKMTTLGASNAAKYNHKVISAKYMKVYEEVNNLRK